MFRARGVEVARGGPSSARRIVQLRAREIAAIVPSCDEHLAVGQQRRRVFKARGVEVARGGPSSARWIVQLRAREIAAAVVEPSCDEHLAVGQQGRRVSIACDVEAARVTKCKGGINVRHHALVRASIDGLEAISQSRIVCRTHYPSRGRNRHRANSNRYAGVRIHGLERALQLALCGSADARSLRETGGN